MNERLFQRPRTTESNYGKYRFLLNSPEELQPMMHERIKSNLRRLHRYRTNRFKVAFKLPEELHFLPLFENVLLSYLIEYHNTTATHERFVHAKTFMVLDQRISRFIPSKLGANLPLETVSDHELKHWIELQSTKLNKNFTWYLLFDLFWGKNKDPKYEALVLSSGVDFTRDADFPIENITMAPNYPSNADFGALKDLFTPAGKITRLLHILKVFVAKRQKAKQQGLSLFSTPLDIDDAVASVYEEWVLENRLKIKTDVYPTKK